MPPSLHLIAPMPPRSTSSSPQQIAIVGAGMAGVACARTLERAGLRVTLFEQDAAPGGRMAAHGSPWGSFDVGAQYFTVRDERFAQALATAPEAAKRWSASRARVLGEDGRPLAETSPPGGSPEPHWVGVPDMGALVQAFARPLAQRATPRLGHAVESVEHSPQGGGRWRLQGRLTDGARFSDDGFDAVLLALPPAAARALLKPIAQAKPMRRAVKRVHMAPCLTLTLAFPQAQATLGPEWNVAYSRHHRVAWIARESSKPQRALTERWTVQASPAWSAQHLDDDDERVAAKLGKAFAELTGIRAEPGEARIWRCAEARTLRPLGRSHLWDAHTGLGLAGDWCIGHRVEDAFLSGLELALGLLAAAPRG
jgi:predicted NAD/FAD-dependent oxidoreductase